MVLPAATTERLTGALGDLDGEPAPLEGGITNRNFRARFGADEVVVRLPGKDTALLGIDRRAEAEANRCAAAAGVAPEVLAHLEEPPCLVTRFLDGRPVEASELREPGRLREVAAALRAVHGCPPIEASFSPFRIVEEYAERARARGGTPPEALVAAGAAAARIEAALGHRPQPSVLCHNDLLTANFLATADGLRVVDWEYAGMGDPYFDLGNFAVNNELGDAEEEVLLAAYLGTDPTAGELARLRLMRFMSDFREAMWAVLQGAISDLDFDFGEYAEKHFDRLREAESNPRFNVLLEEAGGAAG